MTILDSGFMKNELDFVPMVETQLLYKDYYMKICQYVYRNSVYRPTPSEIEEFLQNGFCGRFFKVKSHIETAEERKYLFKRAMGLQLIYDTNNGRQSMIKGTNSADDVCRETYEALDVIGLIQPYGCF